MNGILFSLNPNTSIMVLNTLVLLGECPIALEHGRNDTKIAKKGNSKGELIKIKYFIFLFPFSSPFYPSN